MAEGKVKKNNPTPRQLLFAKEYLIDLNATQAAIRAGYSPKNADRIGHELLKKSQVTDAIQQSMDARAARLDISADAVLQEIAKIGFFNLRDVFDENCRLIPVSQLPANVSAALSSVKVNTTRIPGSEPAEVEHTVEIKAWDKGANLERLGRHLKLFNDVGSKENPFCIDNLTDEQLHARLSALIARAK